MTAVSVRMSNLLGLGISDRLINMEGMRLGKHPPTSRFRPKRNGALTVVATVVSNPLVFRESQLMGTHCTAAFLDPVPLPLSCKWRLTFAVEVAFLDQDLDRRGGETFPSARLEGSDIQLVSVHRRWLRGIVNLSRVKHDLQ